MNTTTEYGVGNFGKEIQRELAAQDRAHDGIEHVIHRHAPAGNVAERRMNFGSDVSKRRTGAGVGPRHAPIADGREQHGDHRNQNGSDRMAVRTLAHHPVNRHGSRGLNDDHPVEDQIPKAESAAEAGFAGGETVEFLPCCRLF